jgi:hypothetical protein
MTIAYGRRARFGTVCVIALAGAACSSTHPPGTTRGSGGGTGHADGGALPDGKGELGSGGATGSGGTGAGGNGSTVHGSGGGGGGVSNTGTGGTSAGDSAGKGGSATAAGGGGAPTSGSGGTGVAGTSGKGGIGGASTEIGVGSLGTCPSSVAEGACPIDGVSCPYPTKSCTCKSGTWACTDCPPAQTLNGGPPYAGRFICRYASSGEFAADGPITCSSTTVASGWGCGMCPTSRPTPGAECEPARLTSKAGFTCAYGDELCSCDGPNGWSCLTPACSPTPSPTAIPNTCGGLVTGYVCRYPSVDQNCSCGGGLEGLGGLTCSCPTARPLEGGACIRTAQPCGYLGWSCACTTTATGGTDRWHCTAVCPTSPPLNGPCTEPLTCNYENSRHCTCDGVSWSCQ